MALTVVLALAQNRTGTGAITGLVVDEMGRPVPGAKLSYNKHTEYVPDRNGRPSVKELGFTGVITAGPDGRFAISGLPSGTYGVCALGSGPNRLGSCDWDPVPAVELATGQRLENLTRTVRDGALLILRVTDPNGRIVLPDSKGNLPIRSRRFWVGVSSDSGGFRRAQLASSTGNEHIFRVMIPKRRSVRLFVDSDLSVTDARSRPIETKRPSSFVVSPAGADQVTADLRVN